MNTGIEKILGLFDRTNRPQVIKSLMSAHNLTHDQAESVWQEAWLVFLDKYNNEPSQELLDNLKGFMWITCRNKAYEVNRQKAIDYNETPLDDDTNPTRESLYDYICQKAWDDDFEQRLKHRMRELSDIAFAQLPVKQQALIRGHYFEGKSMKELAQELDLGDENVAKSTKYRAINQMKKIVQSYDLYTFPAAA